MGKKTAVRRGRKNIGIETAATQSQTVAVEEETGAAEDRSQAVAAEEETGTAAGASVDVPVDAGNTKEPVPDTSDDDIAIPPVIPGKTIKDKDEIPPALKVPQDTMRIPAYLLAQEEEKQRKPAPKKKSGQPGQNAQKTQSPQKTQKKKRSPEERAYLRQREEERKEREEIARKQAAIEEEQRRLREEKKAHREEEEKNRLQAEKRRLAEEEKRINEEVERRVRAEERRRERQRKKEGGIIVSPRVARQKRLMIIWVSVGASLLAMISIFIGIRYDRIRRELSDYNAESQTFDAGTQIEMTQTSASVQDVTEPAGDAEPARSAERSVYLTFDDGPSRVTGQILDILREYGVQATFFVLGRDDEESLAIYKRIVEEGHTLAMHSYTHDMTDIYASLDHFQQDLHRLQNLLYEATGTWCTIYRFPGGSSTTASKVNMQDLIDYLGREHITYFDWNVYGGDDIAPDLMVENVRQNVGKYQNAVILMHDAADKEETARALPEIIEYIQGLENTVMLPITEDTVPVQHGSTTDLQ
ncbi:MAG: polysaccharide deacetylase [Lachnospiraceae bacterium]|nr:polysaccharide deacetylase [Lachnospiraceae bacterium]